MCADIAGYSRLMAEDENATLFDLREFRQDVLEPNVAAHGGKIVKSMGDGWLLEFASVVEAVRCAVEIQEQLRNHRSIRLRIGIHVGDIVHENDDVFGDGVNIAARLQGIAEPGAVYLSQDGWKFLRGKSDVEFISIGEHGLKNIADKVEIFRWPANSPGSVADEAMPDRSRVAGRLPSIIVEDIRPSGSIEQASDLSEELKDTLVLALSRRSGVRVIASNGQRPDTTYAIGGRVRVSDNSIKLSLSMKSTADGANLWAERFEGDVQQIEQFIERVTRRADSAVRTQINAFHGAYLAEQADSSLTVEDLLAKAAYLFYDRGVRKSTELARQSLEVAVSKAPRNPMALAMLAHSYVNLFPYSLSKPDAADATRALALADRAVELGQRIDFAFRTRALLRIWLQGDHEGAQADARRALQINPNYHLAMETLATSKLFAGEPKESAKILTDILALAAHEPQIPYYYSLLALAHLLQGDEKMAAEFANEAYERRPRTAWFGLVRAAAAATDPAETASEGFRSMLAELKLSRSCLKMLPFRRPEDIEFLDVRLKKAGVPD